MNSTSFDAADLVQQAPNVASPLPQILLPQPLRDVHCVQGRALAEVVGRHPHGEAVVDRGVDADAADVDRILSGALDRGHVAFVDPVVTTVMPGWLRGAARVANDIAYGSAA